MRSLYIFAEVIMQYLDFQKGLMEFDPVLYFLSHSCKKYLYRLQPEPPPDPQILALFCGGGLILNLSFCYFRWLVYW